jgi:hypothetical protein
MKQTIHIFTKDLRRFSWEIALALILLAFYVWSQPATWQSADEFFFNHPTTAYWRYLGSSISGFLLMLGWAAMLIRVIAEDSPTGDRQFWVTRPYRWPNLLAAKVLFFIAVVHVPLLIAQIGLLKAAGFAPFHYPGRLFSLHLGLAGFYLCVATLAVVARGSRQFARAVIVVLIFLVVWVWMDSATGNLGLEIGWHNPVLSWIGEAFLIGVPLVVIVLQYARRRTAQSRWVLVGAGLALTLLTAAQPANKLNEAEYPLLAPGTGPSLEVSLEPHLQAQAATPIQLGKKKEKTVLVILPLSAADMPAGYLAQVKAINITLQASDGTHWSSGWRDAYHLFSDGTDFPHEPDKKTWRGLGTPVNVDGKFFEHVRDTAATLHVAIAATLFRDQEGPPMTPVNGEIAVPGVGFCVIGQRNPGTLWCRTAESSLPMMAFSHHLFKSCPPANNELPGPSRRTAWTGTGRVISGFGLSPIETLQFYFGGNDNKQAVTPAVCPDEPITFHRAEVVRQFRVEYDFYGVKLPDYALQAVNHFAYQIR